MMWVLKASLLTLTLAFFYQAVAEEWLDEDSDLLKGARLVYSQSDASANYRLVLSEIKKINSQWRTDRDLNLVGRVERRTYLLRESFSFREALPLLKLHLQNKSAKSLFSCSGFDCGTSSGWANEFFKIKVLYGLDNDQAYWVWQVDDANKVTSYVVLYLVQRGNKRVYLQSDRIYPEVNIADLTISTEVFEHSIETDGFFVLREAVIKKGNERLLSLLEPIASALKQNPRMRFWLVGHDYSNIDLDAQKKLGEEHANKIKDALTSLGVNPSRLSVESVGSLAPAGRKGQARVELVARD